MTCACGISGVGGGEGSLDSIGWTGSIYCVIVGIAREIWSKDGGIEIEVAFVGIT